MTEKTTVTGIKPTGTVHVGNYIGAIKPALALSKEYRSLYFIADYHALTVEHDARELRRQTYDVAAVWLACGLDPARTIFYRQSDIPEVFELAWVLNCFIAAGQLERGHAYKDALAKGEAPNAGLFNYPVLMAADILLFDADTVPVGKDQQQHIELTRDIAERINFHYGENTLVTPGAHIRDLIVLPGLDGQKMSKSRNNVIPLFGTAKELKTAVMAIVTGSESLESPKDPESSSVFQIYRLVATPEKTEALAAKLRAGGFGWGHAKLALLEELETSLGPMRSRYVSLRADEAALDRVLLEGAQKARVIARATLDRVRQRIGVASAPVSTMASA